MIDGIVAKDVGKLRNCGCRTSLISVSKANTPNRLRALEYMKCMIACCSMSLSSRFLVGSLICCSRVG